MSSYPVGDLFRLVFEAAPDPMVLTDSSGVVVYTNRAFDELSGQKGKSLEGKPVLSFIQPIDAEAEQIALCDYWAGRILWSSAEEAQVALSLVIARLADRKSNSDGYILLFRDDDPSLPSVDNRHHARLEALGTLAGGIAHDLNNLLTGVLGHVSFLRLSMRIEGEHAESLSAIEDGARRAAAMTQQILEFARGEESERCSVNLGLVVSAAVNLLSPAMLKNISIQVQGLDSGLCVDGDESQLSQLVMNLAVNARDALPDGGRIEIVLDGCPGSELCSKGLELSPDRHYARLRIADNGTGIPAAVREQIFEPFFTTKASAGTGLGLATVFTVVQTHDGHIDVESEEGQGSAFIVYLPCGEQLSASQSQPAIPAEAPTGSERILVVEDEDAVRTVMQRSLQHLGYEVDVASDGVQALDHYQQHPGAFKLVILDMMMPHMPGDELYFKLREIDSTVRVLIASGYSSDGRARAVLDGGGLGFIQKPFAVEELAAEVRRCLDCPAK